MGGGNVVLTPVFKSLIFILVLGGGLMYIRKLDKKLGDG